MVAKNYIYKLTLYNYHNRSCLRRQSMICRCLPYHVFCNNLANFHTAIPQPFIRPVLSYAPLRDMPLFDCLSSGKSEAGIRAPGRLIHAVEFFDSYQFFAYGVNGEPGDTVYIKFGRYVASMGVDRVDGKG